MPRGCQIFKPAVLVGCVVCALVAPVQGQPEPPPAALEVFVEPSPLLNEPQTPEETFSAVLLMIELARLDMASRYLNQFLAADPDDETLIRLRDKHGTGDFVKLSRIKTLQPQSQELLDRLGVVSRKQAEDVAYAEGLIEKLTADPVQRELAIRELRNLGEAAVPRLVRTLFQSDSAVQIDHVVHALGRIGRPAIAPLLAALDAPQPSVRQSVLSALSLIRGKEAVPYLWHPAFAESELPGTQQLARRTLARILTGSSKVPANLTIDLAASELQRITHGLYYQKYPLQLEDDGTVVNWAWDETAGTVVRKTLPVDEARLFLTTRFSRQSLDLSPESPVAQRMALASQLGWAVAATGRNQSLPLDPGTPGFVALTAGEQTVADVLSEALAARQSGTAQAALQILGEIGSPEQLVGGRGRKSPVLSALNYPDQRVQFAAANTILRIEPRTGFRGADRVIAILNRAISNSEESRALIIDADTTRSEVTSGYLADLGFTPVSVRTGKEGFLAAANSAGIDLAVIHINCVQWDLSQTVANLRADARTAYLPIVLYGPENVTEMDGRFGLDLDLVFPGAASPVWNGTLPQGGRQDPIQTTTRSKLARLILRSEPILFVAESGSSTDFINQIRPFIDSIKAAQLSGEERGQHQAAAVRWLAHLAQGELTHIFDLAPAEQALAGLLDDPNYALTALSALSGIKTSTVQSHFLASAVNSQEPVAVRSTAARMLAFHIQRHGVMLSEAQVRELTEGWNNETDPVVSSALAAVIGSLDPDTKTIGQRIGTLPAPQ